MPPLVEIFFVLRNLVSHVGYLDRNLGTWLLLNLYEAVTSQLVRLVVSQRNSPSKAVRRVAGTRMICESIEEPQNGPKG